MNRNKAIKEAFKEITKQQKKVENKQEEHEFSADFYEKTLKLIEETKRKEKKSIHLFGKQISKVAVVIIILLILGGTVYAAATNMDFIFEFFGINVSLRTPLESSADMKMELDDIYSIEIEGFILQSQEKNENTICVTTYEDAKGELLILTQQVEAVMNIDSENTLETEIEVNNSMGYYSVKNDQSTLLWPEYGYVFEITRYPAISYKEMQEIAVSIKKKEKMNHEETKTNNFADTIFID